MKVSQEWRWEVRSAHGQNGGTVRAINTRDALQQVMEAQLVGGMLVREHHCIPSDVINASSIFAGESFSLDGGIFSIEIHAVFAASGKFRVWRHHADGSFSIVEVRSRSEWGQQTANKHAQRELKSTGIRCHVLPASQIPVFERRA